MNLEDEHRRVLQRDAEWSAVAAAGQDVAAILDFWTEDAQVFPPGQPALRGKAALRAYVEGAVAIPGFRITWSTSEATLSPDGQMAYLLSTNAVTVPEDAGGLVTVRGRAVTVWRREADGEWRCAVDIWNDEPGARKHAGNRAGSPPDPRMQPTGRGGP